MSEKKPPPLLPARTLTRCPVCGETSYSHNGIHPQCSVRQADEKLDDSVKREKMLESNNGTATPAARILRTQKSCPKCKELNHVRKMTCACGHTFTGKGRTLLCNREQE